MSMTKRWTDAFFKHAIQVDWNRMRPRPRTPTSEATSDGNDSSRVSRRRELPPCEQHQLDCFAAGHAEADAEGFGLRSEADDLRVEQVFWLGQRLCGRPLADGDRLAELGGGLQVVDATADDPGAGNDRAVLTPMPAVADPEGRAVLKLEFAAGGAGGCDVHGVGTVCEEQASAR